MKTDRPNNFSDFPNLRWPLRWRIRGFIRDVLVRLKILKPIDMEKLRKKKWDEFCEGKISYSRRKLRKLRKEVRRQNE